MRKVENTRIARAYEKDHARGGDPCSGDGGGAKAQEADFTDIVEDIGQAAW
jgi:hypothetical protein